MPKYIYQHPDTKREVEIVHSMNETKNPSEELLKRITLSDGRVMKRKIFAPALLGFDNLGRSTLGKQEKEPLGECGKPKAECGCDCAPPQSPEVAKTVPAA